MAKLGFYGGRALGTVVLGRDQDLAGTSVLADAAGLVAGSELGPLANLAVDRARATVALLVLDE